MRKETKLELILNAVTHGIGFFLSIFALSFLLTHTDERAQTVGVIVFGVSMIFLYLASTLYHAFPQSMTKTRAVFRRFDHCAIYLLIVGTYTPFVAILVPNVVGFTLLSVLWALTLVGILMKIIVFHRFKFYHYIMYVAMGWSIVFIWPSIYEVVPADALRFLIWGGIAYTSGLVFFGLNNKIPFMHLIWHVFVIAGTLLHFFSVYNIIGV